MTVSESTITGYRPGHWTIDPVHSSCAFTIRHVMTRVHGSFQTFEGSIVTAEDPTNSTASAVIDLSSINTGNAQRDKHLRTGDFFDVEATPKMTYTSRAVRVLDASTIVVEGDLEIRGIRKPVDLQVEVIGFGPDSKGVMRAGFSASAEINRRDFGVNWNSVIEGGGFALADKVSITLDISAALTDQ